jgi:hypothetical protein
MRTTERNVWINAWIPNLQCETAWVRNVGLPTHSELHGACANVKALLGGIPNRVNDVYKAT